jgi:nitroreductase
METLETIHMRCSLKAQLSDRPVEAETIGLLLDAAHVAPSARNSQPWRFVVVEGKEAVEALVDAAFTEPNLVAREAPVVIVACARPADGVTLAGREYYAYDVGSAVQNLLLAATDLGLVTHLIASFDESAVKRVLGIPDDVRVIVATPVAHPRAGSYAKAAEERLSQRTRRPRQEVVFKGRWGE